MSNPHPWPQLTCARLKDYQRCPKRLWLCVHRPELAAEHVLAPTAYDAVQTLRAIAFRLHSDGIAVQAGPDLAAALAQTRSLIEQGHPGPLFGTVFEHEGLIIRPDIVSRSNQAEGTTVSWTLTEVRDAVRIKERHLDTLATQLWVMEKAGINISKVLVQHIDTGFTLERNGDYAGPFTTTDVSSKVFALRRGRETLANAARAMLLDGQPDGEPGQHCVEPQPCGFLNVCKGEGGNEPPWPVSILPNGGWKKWARQGARDLLDLDESTMAKPREVMIVRATRSGTPFHDVGGARQAMAQWPFPRAWLDFETISAAVPRWVGTRPYEQIPFQFSLHLEQADGTIEHIEYLCCDGSDPREGCAQALVAAIPAGATIIAYNAGFERGVLRTLAAQFPQHDIALNTMAERTVDLLPVARNHWYHRDQRGSWSIKAVLPTIAADLDYAALEVKDGGMAQESFLEAIDPATPPERRWALREALRAYCERDSWAMVLLARRLAGEA